MAKVNIQYSRDSGSLFKLNLQYNFSQQSSRAHFKSSSLELTSESLPLYFGNPQWWQSLYMKDMVHVLVTIAKS